MTTLFTSFALIGLAEMADKTQLLTLCLTCRYRARSVLIGVALAIAVLNLFAVGLGGAVGELLPTRLVQVGAGLIFLGFGAWTIISAGAEEDEEEACDTSRGRNAILAVALAFFVAELGDKTQLATLSLAASGDSLVLVWLGATLGMLAANGLAVAGGTALNKRLSEQTLKRLSGGLFIVFGLLTLITAL